MLHTTIIALALVFGLAIGETPAIQQFERQYCGLLETPAPDRPYLSTTQIAAIQYRD